MAVKVKICGLTSHWDVEAARFADCCGFIVESPSPRNLIPNYAKDLMSAFTTKE